jgi:phospho-N-acetylmuramoyl-pentapeptide-transferase
VLSRMLIGLLIAFFVSALLARPLIRYLREHGVQTFHWLKQDIDNKLFYSLHEKKIGTPAMGGLLMLGVTTVVGALLFPVTETWVFLAAFVPLSLLGLFDDVSKALVKAGLRKDDFAALPKFIVQWAIAFVAAGLLYGVLGRHVVGLPFVGGLDLGVVYVPFVAFVIVTTANAANITDGLDGLAGGLAVIALTALAVVALLRGQPVAAGLGLILTGATLGFLLFNVHPAKVFMGDVGSMALGAGLAMLALFADALVPFVVIVGVFAFDLLSSFIQTLALRRGKRVFKIAPFHHHLEALGWPETRITQTFWVVGMVLAFGGVLISLY